MLKKARLQHEFIDFSDRESLGPCVHGARGNITRWCGFSNTAAGHGL
jgi:hypothetical protein